ncbi:histidine phosphatase family protein [Alkalihalobacillus pseudalcaliphilus]|nr:histidine phosphatase family protein [Alkalihalobacillus pseudalcaliphilus]
MANIYLVRHGGTDWNKQGKWQGERIFLNAQRIKQGTR